jgi:uncharacterized protein (DUF58 family)
MPAVTTKHWLYQRYWRFISRYLDKRQPAATKVKLVQKLIFILPSRYGWWFLLLIILLYLLGTNYQNNLILLLSYLLLSLFLFSIAMCYHNMSGLTLSCNNAAEGYAQQQIDALITLSSKKQHFMLRFNFVGQPLPVVLQQLPAAVSLSLTAQRRGKYALPRIKISSQYPFGLWQAWSYIALEQHYWVYPAAASHSRQTSGIMPAIKQQRIVPSSDNLMPYRSGDSLRNLVWKRLARDPANPVVRQQHSAPETEPNWVVVAPASGDALERALCQACRQLLTLEQAGERYGLQLPHLTVPLSSGPAHLQRCLQELALC